jgi:UDP-GlcNAc3NAcA epimerase
VKVVSVVGARPQFVKAAVVSREFRKHHGLTELLVHTGQHYDDDMSEAFFRELGIPEPDKNLGVGPGSHSVQTGRMMQGIEEILKGARADWVLVYGDTNSTLAAALTAAKAHVPVAHVEAGLRSFNREMPEEINRIVADHLSMRCFAPTNVAVNNLLHEGIPEPFITLVGDVMFDASLIFGDEAESRIGALERLGIEEGGYILATVHRAENTDNGERLAAIVNGLAAVAAELPVVIPLHPRTRAALERAGLFEAARQVLRLLPPVGYLDMLLLEKRAAVVVTDSGGVQKEAFFCRVPCVTLRDETEWLELVELGWNQLVPPLSPEHILEGVRAAIGTRGAEAEPYGDGRAAERIVEVLLSDPGKSGRA